MQKVTLKYDYQSTYITDAPRNYEMVFDMSEMSFEEFMGEIKKFAILVGYAPETVENAFE